MRRTTVPVSRPARCLYEKREPDRTIKISGPILNLAMIALSVMAAYFMTIQSLKIELAAKAENAVVETLDKKLGAFEVLLREGVVSREQFYQFSREIDQRLARIEHHLTTNPETIHAKP